jgi:hyperosmotically inducible periplasmic protein
MFARLFATVVAVMLVAPAAFAQTSPQVNNDDLLTADVIRAVNTYTRFTIFDDINIAVENGVVTLSGKVTMPYKRDEIGARIERLDGVRSVNNEIDVLPVSIYDDELRRTVARAIYGNSAFWGYAAMVNPPIHIIVERGRVTLTGVVGTEVDKALARSLATGRGELSLISELRTDAEVREARSAEASFKR